MCYCGGMRSKYSVIIPSDLLNVPSEREISAAWLLAKYFRRDVVFVKREISKTPDFLIGQEYWELKTIEGNGKRTIQHALQRAARQAENVVVDGRWAKLDGMKMRSQLRHYFVYIPRLKRLLLIEKGGKKVLEIFK